MPTLIKAVVYVNIDQNHHINIYIRQFMSTFFLICQHLPIKAMSTFIIDCQHSQSYRHSLCNVFYTVKIELFVLEKMYYIRIDELFKN